MSASPADRTPGQTPNGTLPQVIRRPKAADPLVRPKDRRKRPLRTSPATSGAANPVNGRPLQYNLTVPGQGTGRATAQPPPKPFSPDPGRISTLHDVGEISQSGFSSAPLAPYRDYPLIMTKRDLAEHLRHHIAKFSSKKDVDPRSEAEFKRPVKLHRRDAKAPPPGAGDGPDEDGGDSKDGIADSKEREAQEILRAQREAEREEEMKKVAPAANPAGQKRPGNFQKKVQQVFRNDETEEQVAGSKLRYEEALPWHLEDCDGKQVWTGSYEAVLSETHAALRLRDDKFYMTPVEKWYKFTAKPPFSTLTTDEAEKRMERKVKDPRWFMDSQKVNLQRREEQKNKKATSKLYVGRVSTDDSPMAGTKVKREGEGGDGLDYEEDWADDEGPPMIEGEAEDAKEAEERIKRDQLQANIFDLKDEKEYDKADMVDKKFKEAEKVHGKKVKKALMKREKNFIYDSESSNPYSEESESIDTEAERLKEEQTKKEAEEKKNTPQPTDKPKDKPSSGATSKGSNTPTNRPSKNPDQSQRHASASLKRPGSPNLSEQSGNESSRKKRKNNNPVPKAPISRPRSPAPSQPSSAPEVGAMVPTSMSGQRKTPTTRPNVSSESLSSAISARPDVKHARAGAGSGSEGEGVASSGEMSDGTRKRIRLRLTSPGSKSATPRGSRAGSPENAATVSAAAASSGGATVSAATGSRFASPAPAPPTSTPAVLATPAVPPPSASSIPAAAPGSTSTSTSTATPLQRSTRPFPTAAEVIAQIPKGGTTITQMIKVFRSAIISADEKKRFIHLLKTVSKYNKNTKTLYMPDEEGRLGGGGGG